MKFTIVGDPHAKPGNLHKIAQLFENIEQLGNPCIILGDLLDTKEVVRGSCLNKYLELLGKSKLQFYVLVGNHDWFNLECQDHSLQALKALPNVTVVDKPITLPHLNIALMPYMPLAQTKSHLSSLDASMTVFAHLDVVGFDYGNGYICQEGVSTEDFQKNKQVISGHYHKFQKKGNLTYLGTPFSHSFGESNQKKYIGIFDSETGVLSVEETKFPKHTTVKIDAEDQNLKKVLNALNKTNDYNRVEILKKQTGLSIDLTPWSNIKFIETIVDAEAGVQHISETLSPEQQFQHWAETIGTLDKETIDLGMEILKNV